MARAVDAKTVQTLFFSARIWIASELSAFTSFPCRFNLRISNRLAREILHSVDGLGQATYQRLIDTINWSGFKAESGCLDGGVFMAVQRRPEQKYPRLCLSELEYTFNEVQKYPSVFECRHFSNFTISLPLHLYVCLSIHICVLWSTLIEWTSSNYLKTIIWLKSNNAKRTSFVVCTYLNCYLRLSHLIDRQKRKGPSLQLGNWYSTQSVNKEIVAVMKVTLHTSERLWRTSFPSVLDTQP